MLALACAALFAVRDNIVRWAARGVHPPPLVAADVVARRRGDRDARLRARDPAQASLRRAARGGRDAFAPAGIALAVAYDFLFVAFDRGRVSIVAPLNATQSLWAVLLSGVIWDGSTELIGRPLVLAATLIVAGAAVISVVR